MRQSSTKKGLKYRIFQWLAIPLLIACGAMANEMASEEVTPQEAIAALKVAGLEMNDEEIDMLLPTLEEYREAYAEMRETPIDNGVSPSLEFDPRPEGFIMPTDSFFQYPRPVTAPSPLTSDSSALAFEGITILATRLRLGQITSVELTSYFLNRLRKYDEQLHCVISLTEELALEQAARADSELAAGKDRGILHGIPYGAKDLFATKRYRTTWGATPYRDQAFDYDAAAIEKMEEAGAILVAKLSLGALAWGDVWYGEMTRNPWDPATGSSGSSAGSASAVSAGLVPFALGTETLGSIVSPSTTCGVTGLRPTFGRVSRFGAMALSWTMDKIGPITRSADDAIIVLKALHGKDQRDPYSVDAPLRYGGSNSRSLRIGYVESDFDDTYPFQSQDQQTLDKLKEIGFELIPIELPDFPPIRSILEVEAAAAFDELTRSGRDDELKRQIVNAWPNVLRAARFVPAVEYVQANRHRRLLIEKMAEIFDEVDLYIHPTFASQSLVITNFTGHPCITIPNGFQENGLPTSITLTGALFAEGDIAQVAQEYQDATQWDNVKPEGY